MLSPTFPSMVHKNKRFEDAVLEMSSVLYSPSYAAMDDSYYDQISEERQLNNKKAMENRFLVFINTN